MNTGDRNSDHHPCHPDRQHGQGDGQPAQRCNEKQHTFVRPARARRDGSTLHLRQRDR